MTSENPLLVPEGFDSQEVLRSMLCCTGEDHTIEERGEVVNMVQTEWAADWEFLTVTNVLVKESYDYPLAAAIVCDRCIDSHPEGFDLQYVVAGDPGPDNSVRYWRVPIEELRKPEIYWPDLHPDNQP